MHLAPFSRSWGFSGFIIQGSDLLFNRPSPKTVSTLTTTKLSLGSRNTNVQTSVTEIQVHSSLHVLFSQLYCSDRHRIRQGSVCQPSSLCIYQLQQSTGETVAMPRSPLKEQGWQQPMQAGVHSTVFMPAAQAFGCIAWEANDTDRPGSPGAGCNLPWHLQLTLTIYNLKRGSTTPHHKAQTSLHVVLIVLFIN